MDRRKLCGAVAVALLLVGAWWFVSRGPRPEAAQWVLDPSFTPAPDATRIPVLVQEAACASGQPATGRLHVHVRYSSAQVTIDVRVTPLLGSGTCQAVVTPLVVNLREPLGTRTLVDANSRSS